MAPHPPGHSHVRRNTNVEVDVETTPFAHKYLIKRPVVKEHLLSAHSSNMSLQNTRSSHTGFTIPGEELDEGEENGHIDNPMVEKRRFELFIDLIWVGIIGNVAEHFSDQAYTPESTFTIGEATAEFIILFLIAWRMWINLSNFMNKYHTNDIVERVFIIWQLLLAMVYGNNAPYLIDETRTDKTNIALAVYLISRGSYSIIEGIYSIFLPYYRRELIVKFLLALPTLGIWIPAFYVKYPTSEGLLIAAIVAEFWIYALVETPLFERILKGTTARPFDADHWVERVQDFFIIILGEGVLNLIKGSTLGPGITGEAGTGALALSLYYFISGLYFNGDQSRRYVHAVKRTFWRKTMWMFFHTIMFHATLILGVAIVFIVQHPLQTSLKPPPEDNPSDEELSNAHFMTNAKWSSSIAFSTVVVCLTFIATLSRSLDRPGDLKVTNRWLRLLPRLALITVSMCLVIDNSMSGVVHLSIMVALLSATLNWEWWASLEKDGKLVEP